MQIRKLVKSGAASHTVALPKDWITNNKLIKGDLIYIENKNNELIISANTKETKKEEKEIEISIDDKNEGTIRRQTISAYIKNYNKFIFRSEEHTSELQSH